MNIEGYNWKVYDPLSSDTRKYRRQYRELSDETKQRISTTTQGRPKTAEHRQHIAQGMRRYWHTVPHRPTMTDAADTAGTTGTQGYINGSTDTGTNK